jgi:phage-related protein
MWWMKQLQFVNDAAQEETRELPIAIRRAIGFQLQRVQRGEMPEDFKPMKSVGAGVYEIRADDEHGNNIGRCFYVAKFGDTVWVLHSFVKKARKTPKGDLEIGIKRYKELLKRIERG